MLVFSFLGLIGLCAAFFVPKSEKTIRGVVLLVSIVFLIGGLLVSSIKIVNPGRVGVKIRMGKVVDQLGSGTHLLIPGIEKMVVMDVQTLKVSTDTSASSRDLQDVSTSLTLNYNINPESVKSLYENVGMDYKVRIIDPVLHESLKSVAAQYTAEELIRLRPKVKGELEEAVRTRLLEYGLKVPNGGVSITDFDFSEEFNRAIEAKQVAQQEAEKQKYVLQRAELEKATAITAAEGEAEANRIKATALKSQGGQLVLYREWINKWDGKLPTVMTGSDGLILDVTKLQQSE